MESYVNKKKEELNNLLNKLKSLETKRNELFYKRFNNWCEINMRRTNNQFKQITSNKYTKELKELEEKKNITKFTVIINIILAIISIIIGILNLPIAPITYLIFAFSLPISLSCAISADNKKMELEKKNISNEEVINLQNEIINNTKEIDKLTAKRNKNKNDITMIDSDIEVLNSLISDTENIINYITKKNTSEDINTKSNNEKIEKPKTRIKRKETDK